MGFAIGLVLGLAVGFVVLVWAANHFDPWGR